MKKILSLFAALAFSAASAMAGVVLGEAKTYDQLSDGMHIALKGCSRTNANYLCYDNGFKNQAEFGVACEFVLEAAGDGTFYLKNVSSAKYVGTATGASSNTVVADATSGAAKFTLTQVTACGDADFTSTVAEVTRFTTKVNNTDADTYLNCQGGGATAVYRTGTGAWSFYKVFAVETVETANVTYHYVLGTSTKDVVVEQTVGEPVVAPAIPFATLDYDNTALVAQNLTVNVEVTENLPFVTSTGFASATWQYWANAKYKNGESTHPYAYYDEAKDFLPMAENLDGSDAFKWAFVGNVLTGFKIMNKAAGADKYLYIATADNGATPVMSETERTWELVEGSTDRSLPGTKPFTFVSDGKYINDYANNGKVSFWKDAPSADNGSNWAVFPETVDVTIGSATYATLYCQYPVEVPAGVKAYTLALNEETHNLTATEVATIPARCGVVLEGAANNYSFAVKTATAATSCLSGVFVETATPENCCTFAVEEGVPGFYSYTGANVAANKAYYIAPAAGESNYRISFDELTSIISAAKENGGQAIFDLQGRRVVNAKGINIVNGKKVIR